VAIGFIVDPFSRSPFHLQSACLQGKSRYEVVSAT